MTKWIETESKHKIWDSRYLQDLRDSAVTMYPTDPNPSDVKAQIKVFFNFSDPVDHINHGSVCRDK